MLATRHAEINIDRLGQCTQTHKETNNLCRCHVRIDSVPSRRVGRACKKLQADGPASDPAPPSSSGESSDHEEWRPRLRSPSLEPAPERARGRSRSPPNPASQPAPPPTPTDSPATAPGAPRAAQLRLLLRVGAGAAATAPGKKNATGAWRVQRAFLPLRRATWAHLPSSASTRAPAPAAQAPECPRLPSRPQVSSSPFFLQPIPQCLLPWLNWGLVSATDLIAGLPGG